MKTVIKTLVEKQNWLSEVVSDIHTFKTEQSTDFPVGIPESLLELRRELSYNKMTVELLNHWTKNVKYKRGLSLGSYLRIKPVLKQNRLKLEIKLTPTWEAELLTLLGTQSNVDKFVKVNLLPILDLLISFDLSSLITDFEALGFELDSHRQLTLCYCQSFDQHLKYGIEIFNQLIDLSKNKESWKEANKFLRNYFKVIFKNDK